ncbi:hypothetical protein HWV07_08615 [Natronomonas salina]|uniref:hypothetical protein n=1 Tax=Natronomonas salina TaxID=1710540 RepID=UPI0015B58321|nr:hypothetical protein [Natronomonas salina]QLD89089.1 hypothetical protein HWV07_08615 [Natronomonas salina]
MDTDTTDLILTLYAEQEISEYAARELLDDETIDHYNEKLEQARHLSGQQSGGDAIHEWPDDMPLPYGHLSEDEYYGTDSFATDD